jgi:hypothetical protein
MIFQSAILISYQYKVQSIQTTQLMHIIIIVYLILLYCLIYPTLVKIVRKSFDNIRIFHIIGEQPFLEPE